LIEWLKIERARTMPFGQRDGQAGVHAAVERSQHATGRRAVDVDLIAEPCVERRDHVGLVVVHEAEVAHERLVEDRVDHGAVVHAALGLPTDACAVGHGPLAHTQQPTG
jgi:hypothetical protein